MTPTATLHGDRLFAHLGRYLGHPAWYQDIIHEVDTMVIRCPLINSMRKGHPEGVRTYWIRIWPFVKGFTGYVQDALDDFQQIAWPEWVEHELVTQAVDWLIDQRKEEQWHSDLWVEDALRCGVTYHELDTPLIHPSVQALMANMASGPTLVHRMLRFVTTEIVAELVGTRLNESPEFCALHGVPAVRWCAVHIQDRRPGHIPTHEELGHRLAQLIADVGYGPQPTEAFCRAEILHTATLFHAMGE